MAARSRLTHPAVVALLGLLAAALVAAAAQKVGPVVLFALAAGGAGLLLLDRPAAAAALLVGLVILLEGDPDALIPGGDRLYTFIGPKVTGLEALLALATAAALLGAAARGRVTLPEPLTLPLLLLALGLVAGMVTGMAAGASALQALQGVRQALPLLLVPVIVVNVVPDAAALRRAIGALGGLTAFKAVVGVAGVTTGLAAVYDANSGSRSTYLESPANILTMVFLCVVAAAALSRVRLPRWVMWMAPIVLLSLALSYRRSFWIGTTAALLLVLLLASGRVGRRLLVPGALVLVGAVWLLLGTGIGGQLNGSVVDRAESLKPSKVRANDQDRYRLSERRNVLLELREHPITGIGLGTGWTARKPMPTEHIGGREYVHFAALWWWMKLGILGLIGYVALLTTAIVSGLRTARRHQDPVIRVAVLGAACALVGLAIAEVTATFLGSETRTSVVGGALLGLIAVAHLTAGPRHAAPSG